MDEMEFDKTRKSIRTDSIKDGDRKELLNKFTGAGGQVLKEKSVQKEDSGNSSSKKKSGGGDDRPLPSQMAREQRRKEMDMQSEVRKQLAREEKEARSAINKFLLKLRARMSGVASFSSDQALPGFLSVLNLDLKRALMEANILGHELFMLNPETGAKIIKKLDEENPLLVELIEFATEIYDRSELSDLTADYNSRPNQPVPLANLQTPLHSILRKLYAIRPYQETYLIATDKAIDIQQKLENKNIQLSTAKKKKIRTEWNRIFNTIYPQMVLLAQRMEPMKAEPGSRLFEQMIQYSPVDYALGTRSHGDPVGKIEQPAEPASQESPENQDAEEEEESKVEEEQPEPPASAENGMAIMRSLTPEGMIRTYLQKNEGAKLSQRDKVFLTYLFFRFFENEYSFIMSTSKLKMNATFRGGEKLDLKRKMGDHLESTRTIYELFRKYIHENEEYQKGVSDGAFTSNYVEHAKRMQLLEGRRANTGREFREKVKEFMEGLSGYMKILIDDMDAENSEILENPDDVLTFDNLEAANRLNNKTIEQAIRETYSFTNAFAFRLEEGDLFGGVLEMGEEEFENAFPNTSSLGNSASSNKNSASREADASSGENTDNDQPEQEQ